MNQISVEEKILPLSENKKSAKKFVGAERKERRNSISRWVVALRLLVFVAVLYMVFYSAVLYNKWSQSHGFQKPYEFYFSFRPVVVEIKPKEVISPISREVINPLPKDLDSIEQKICNRWGVYECKTAIAVFRCESGLRPEAVNWDTKDVGIAQINWTIWEKPVKEKFGYTLKDMFDVDKNLDVALWIYDRDGNGVGSYEPWVAFNTGKFKSCMK